QLLAAAGEQQDGAAPVQLTRDRLAEAAGRTREEHGRPIDAHCATAYAKRASAREARRPRACRRGDTSAMSDTGPARATAAPQLYALFGPTAVGKTDVALALAELLRARGEDPVAVSADAMQVYAG